MNAFATAMNVIFADANMAVGAIWFAGGTGSGLAVRVIRKPPDEITPFGNGRILFATTQLDARIADMPSPASGDLIRIGLEDCPAGRTEARPRTVDLNLEHKACLTKTKIEIEIGIPRMCVCRPPSESA